MATPNKQTIESLAQIVAREIKGAGITDRDFGTASYNYSGGFVRGIDAALIQVFGFDYDWDNVDANNDPKDNSVAAKVRERSLQLRDELDALDNELNGEYVDQGGKKVKIRAAFDGANERYVTRHDDDGRPVRDNATRIMSNEFVRDAIKYGVFTKYVEPVEPALDQLLEPIEA